MSKRIENYALLGDFQSAALVGCDGSIDWLCWPRFDSGALFAALLGNEENGHWILTAAGKNVKRSRKYRHNTLILETDIETDGGAASVIDFMPLRASGISHLIRLVEGRRGKIDIRTELTIRFDYGLVVPWITRIEKGGIKAVAGPDMAVLRTEAPLEAQGFMHSSSFSLAAGERMSFVLSYGRSYRRMPSPIDPWEALEETQRTWQNWAKSCEENGPYSEAVLRSLITLKALTFRPTGRIVAAPTTSLPEEIGGVRNWDYRYCWLRDATFTLLALLNSGFRREADEWRVWLRRAVAGSPRQMQIVYGLAGERRLCESEIAWLPGFENSRPVRIGNAAANQLQLDVFGEVMDALYQGSITGLDPHLEAWALQETLIEYLQKVWKLPDQGLWEVRGGPRQFTHSKVMAWVAVDRAIKSVERFRLPAPIEEWRLWRQHIHDQVCREGFNSKIGAFTQSYGSNELDASALLMTLVGFLPPSDPRIRSTVEAIGSQLRCGRLIRRYRREAMIDGVKGGEGVFLACSFWYADNLILLGRRNEAVELFEYLLSLRNDVGLLSEEYDAEGSRMLGNFPQAFSHVALVNTAHLLERPRKPARRHRHEVAPASKGPP